MTVDAVTARTVQFREVRYSGRWHTSLDVLIDSAKVGRIDWDNKMGHWAGKTDPETLKRLGFRRTVHGATGLPIVLFGQDLSEVVACARRKLGKLRWKRGVLESPGTRARAMLASKRGRGGAANRAGL